MSSSEEETDGAWDDKAEMETVKEQSTLVLLENLRLNEEVVRLENSMSKLKSVVRGLREECDSYKRKVRDLQTRHHKPPNYSISPSPSARSEDISSPVALSCSPSRHTAHQSPLFNNEDSRLSLNDPVLESMQMAPAGYGKRSVSVQSLPKVAGKVRLKRVDVATQDTALGAEISTLGVSSTKVAEHIIQDIAEESSMQEKLHGLNKENYNRQFEVELERLRCQASHLRAQMEVLEMSLNESRNNSEQLATICAQHEANESALCLALTYADLANEAVDSLYELKRKQAECLLNNSSTTDKSKVEKLAISKCHGLEKWERFLDKYSILRGNDSSVQMQELDTRQCKSFESVDQLEKYLLTKLEELKEDKEALQRSLATPLLLGYEMLPPSPIRHAQSVSSGIGSSVEGARADLENAVFVQELSALKEEKADLKAQLYLSEREKSHLLLSLKGKCCELDGAYLQVSQTQTLLEQTRNSKLQDVTDSDPVDNGTISLPKSVLDSMQARMKEMSERMSDLAENADERDAQAADLITDLKRANSALVEAFERCKRKYANKLRKTERGAQHKEERFICQIHFLKQQINMLEKQILEAQTVKKNQETEI